MDFDKVIDRRGTFCTQWDYIEDRFGKGNNHLIPFTISDMDFTSPPEIINALQNRINHMVFGYSRWNTPEFKSAISNWFKKRADTYINHEWVVYSPSVLYSITLILEKYLKNKKVMTHTPRYDGISKLLKPYNIYEFPLTESHGEYQTDFDKIEIGFKAGVEVFLLCNPQNPTGKAWQGKELMRLIKLAKKYDVLIISDEIHMDITRKPFTSILKLDATNSIVVSSASKTFNTPALGGSFAIIPNEKLREEFLYHTREIDGVSTAAIMGVLALITAYNDCEYWVIELNQYIYKNMCYVKEHLHNYKGLKVFIPEATYLMWIDIKGTPYNQKELQKRLINIGGVAIMSGELYGDEDKIRLNVGCSREKLILGVEGIKKALINNSI